MRQKLTKSAVELAPAGTKRTFIWDAGDGATKGFGLKVMPSGVKVFIYQYRMGGRDTPTQRYTIGAFGGGMTVEKARKIAEGLEREVGSGLDPQVRVRASNEAERVNKAAAQTAKRGRVELVLDKYLAMLDAQHPPFRSVNEYRRILEKELVGSDTKPGPWRGRLVTDIGKADIRDILRRVGRRGSKQSMRNHLVAISAFFGYVMEEDFREDNPARGISLDKLGYKAASRDRTLTPQELRKVWLAALKTPYPYGPIFQLLILTAQRRDEVAGLEMAELTDTSMSPWILPAARTKNATPHVVHLSPQALRVISALPARRRLLFPAAVSKRRKNADKDRAIRPVSGFSTAVRALKEACGFSDWRLHDLRRTFATVAAEIIKVPPHVTDKVLNHKVGSVIKGVAAVYQRAEFLEERQAALDAWGTYVEALAAAGTGDALLRASDLAREAYVGSLNGKPQRPRLKLIQQ